MKKCLLIAVLGILVSTPCQAQEWRAAVTTTDLFLWRPLTFAGTIAGGALWLVSLPVTVPSKTQGEVLDVMVKKPYQWTFQRPLPELPE